MKLRQHLITREIGIDAGHRVTYHHSKCRSIHGHRYVVQASCAGELAESGSTEGMAGGLDFGFLKDEMMAEIDGPCDHGLILWVKDPLLATFVRSKFEFEQLPGITAKFGAAGITGHCGKLYVVPFVPTAENLARHWFERLEPRIKARSEGRATLVRIRTYETPNCWADFPTLST
jgi:6-pyruvoyltetrahydropterin/6-carboxytetrahydropterin synthase